MQIPKEEFVATVSVGVLAELWQEVERLRRRVDELEPYSHSRPEPFCQKCQRYTQAVCEECGEQVCNAPT